MGPTPPVQLPAIIQVDEQKEYEGEEILSRKSGTKTELLVSFENYWLRLSVEDDLLFPQHKFKLV